MPPGLSSARTKKILAVVRRIPRGTVAAYGEVAYEAGYPRGARQVGTVLGGLDPASTVPWHRVVNAKGEISPRGEACVARQRERLEAEGVEFSARGRIDLSRFGWLR